MSITGQHRCQAVECKTPVTGHTFMCADHWLQLPEQLQDLAWRYHETGQYVTSLPSFNYLYAIERIVEWLAERDGDRSTSRELSLIHI